MAKGPRVVGQVFETPQDVKAKQYDLIQNLEQDAPAIPKDEEKGRDAPLISAATEEELESVGLLKNPVDSLGLSAQDRLDSTIATTEAVHKQGVTTVGTADAAKETIEAAGTPVEELSPEQQAQRESEKVPSLLRANGLSTNLDNIVTQLGPYTGTRLAATVNTPLSYDVVNLRLDSFDNVAADVDVGTDKFEETIEAKDKAKIESSKDKPMMMRKDNSSLILTPQNIFTSKKALGGLTNRNPVEGSEQVAGINKKFNPVISMAVEDFMLNQAAAREKIATKEEDTFDPAVVDEADVSMARLGRDSFQQLRRVIADMEGTDTDEYVQDFRNLTPEAFELIGKSLMAYYQAINPRMVDRVNMGPEGGESQYVLTQFGEQVLRQEAGNVSVPNFNKQFLYVPPTEGRYQYESSLLPTRSGANPNLVPEVVEEGNHNSSQVKSVIDSRRGVLFAALQSAAVATNPVIFGPTSENFTHNLVEQGSERINKVMQIGQKQAAKLEAINLELEDIANKLALRPKNPSKLEYKKEVLLQQKEAVEKVRAKYTPAAQYALIPGHNPEYLVKEDEQRRPIIPVAGSELRPAYFSFVAKHMEVAGMLGQYSGKPFYHTFNNQSGTHRFNVIQTNSFQTNHMMRNIIGSGVKYVIKPGSNTTQERALLRGFGHMFFGAEGYMAEPQLKAAKDNIRLQSPRYKALVGLGDKLIQLTNSLDPKGIVQGFKGLKVTPKGIVGIDRISDTSIVSKVNADPELKALFDSLSNQKDSHKHSIQLLDYMMALADYSRSLKEGKPFHSSVNAIEIDGISNGLTTMQAMLGNISAMYRGGLLRAEGEERVLGIFKDIEEAEAYRGKLRTSLQIRMEGLLNGTFGALTLTDNRLMKKFNYGPEQLPLINEIITLAIKDDANFLKPPLMTFPYGQELRNLVGSARDTIIASPELSTLANEFGGVTNTAAFLNAVREPALIETLGVDLVNFAAMAKQAANVSAMFGLPIETVSPAGGTISFGGKSYIKTGKEIKPKLLRTRVREANEEGVPYREASKGSATTILQRQLAAAKEAGNLDMVRAIEAKLGKGSTLSARSTIAEKEKFFDPTAERGGRMGAVASGQILPSLAQSVDGSTIAQLFSNESMDGLNNEIGSDPYILPIFDAVITDLGSFEAVERKVNQIFYRNVTQSKMLEGLDESLNNNIKAGVKVYKQMANSKGNEAIDEVFDGGVADMVVDLLEKNFRDEDGRMVGPAQYHVNKLKLKGKEKINVDRTYKNLFEAQMYLMNNLYSNLQSEFGNMVSLAKTRNKDLQAKVAREEQKIMQYEMDPGINVNFLGFLPPN